MLTCDVDEVLTRERGIPQDKLPRAPWARHEKFAIEYGVELKEWPEPGGVCNPSKLTSTARLTRVKNALDTRECRWVVLSQEEWDARKIAAEKGKGKGRASSDDMEIDEDNDGEEEDGESQAQGSSPPSLYPPSFAPTLNQPLDLLAFNSFGPDMMVAPSFQPELDPNLPWDSSFLFMEGSSQGPSWAS